MIEISNNDINVAFTYILLKAMHYLKNAKDGICVRYKNFKIFKVSNRLVIRKKMKYNYTCIGEINLDYDEIKTSMNYDLKPIKYTGNYSTITNISEFKCILDSFDSLDIKIEEKFSEILKSKNSIDIGCFKFTRDNKFEISTNAKLNLTDYINFKIDISGYNNLNIYKDNYRKLIDEIFNVKTCILCDNIFLYKEDESLYCVNATLIPAMIREDGELTIKNSDKSYSIILTGIQEFLNTLNGSYIHYYKYDIISNTEYISLRISNI